RHDEKGNRLSFLKAFSGMLQVRDKLAYGPKGLEEKVTQIRHYNGQKFLAADQAHAGELFAVSGLTEASVGDTVGKLQGKANFGLVPTLKSTVLFDSSLSPKEVLANFRMLDAEDPSLSVFWDEYFQQIQERVMGNH